MKALKEIEREQNGETIYDGGRRKKKRSAE